ncbi:MAG: hypothetical protein WB774_21920, partial [Xanthobacteraceae bacterium]
MCNLLTLERMTRRVAAQASEISAILVQDRLIAQKLAAILVKCCLVRPRVDLGADLPRLDVTIVVATESLNGARDVGTKNDSPRRIDCSRRRHRTRNAAARHRHGCIARDACRAEAPQSRADPGCGNRDDGHSEA